MSYKDRTWCPDNINTRCRLHNMCPRILSKLDKRKIVADEELVSYFAKEPQCFKEKKK